MTKYKIIHQRDKCIGCGNCVAICPQNWEMTDDGKAEVKETEIDTLGCNKQAEEMCPVGCIQIKEIKSE